MRTKDLMKAFKIKKEDIKEQLVMPSANFIQFMECLNKRQLQDLYAGKFS